MCFITTDEFIVVDMSSSLIYVSQRDKCFSSGDRKTLTSFWLSTLDFNESLCVLVLLLCGLTVIYCPGSWTSLRRWTAALFLLSTRCHVMAALFSTHGSLWASSVTSGMFTNISVTGRKNCSSSVVDSIKHLSVCSLTSHPKLRAKTEQALQNSLLQKENSFPPVFFEELLIVTRLIQGPGLVFLNEGWSNSGK